MLTDLIATFPNLATEPYTRTSPCTFDYNCIAYASGDQTQRWDPALGFYWPPGIPRDWKVATLVRVFDAQGYVPCQNADQENGFEKVAIYRKKNRATHAAKQLLDGKWTSKLGDLDDITHTLDGLAGDMYGTPARYMRRPIRVIP